MDVEQKLKASREANLALYSEYNKTLRSWLVAYGIGLPALFVSSKDAKEFMLKAPCLKTIIVIFLFGVLSQILISFVNKFVSWCAFHRDDCQLREISCKSYFEWPSKLEDSIWIDLLFDGLTLLAFVAATCMLLVIKP